VTVYILIATLTAFLITYFLAPPFIRKMKQKGITGVDVHKPNKPVCAEMGGILILAGFLVPTLFFMALKPFDLKGALAELTIILVGVVGIIDDLYTLRQRHKVLLTFLVSVPIALAVSGRHEVWFPFFGDIELGYWYLFLAPLGVMVAANLTNMLAGFNGLECGIGVINLFALGWVSLFLEALSPALVAFALCAAYLAFLVYNWYPAKIFPGDTGTLVSGAAVAIISIVNKVEFVGMIMLLPATIDFMLKAFNRQPFAQRTVYGDTKVKKDGTLEPASYAALPHALLKVASLNEKELVKYLLTIQIIHSVIALIVFVFFM